MTPLTGAQTVTPNMVYKGHCEITTVAVPHFLWYDFGKIYHMPLLPVPYKGVPYKTYWM